MPIIPALWFRLIVLIGFCVLMYLQELVWVAAAGAVLSVLTIIQLVGAYRRR